MLQELFEYNERGYQLAKQFLESIGELPENNETYRVMNHIQFINEANKIKEQQIILNG